MTTAVPPPPPPPPSPPPASPPPPAPGVSTAVVVNPPAKLVLLALGSLVRGTVGDPDGQGGFQVRTPLGTLTLRTGFPLPRNSSLVLQLQSLDPRVEMRIVSIDGRPPSPGTRPRAAPRPGGGSAAEAPISRIVGTTVTATLLRPAPAATGGGPPPPGRGAPASAAAGTVPQPPGASGRAGSGTVPGTAPQPPGATGRAGSGTAPGTAPAPGATTAGPPGAAPGAAATLAAGTRVGVRIVAIRPPQAAGRAAPPPPGQAVLGVGRTLGGVVTGATASGQPVVRTHAGLISLATPTPIPEGSSLTLEVTGRPVPPPATMATPGLQVLRQGLMQTRAWPALEEAVQALQEANPQAARQVISTVIPQANSRLAATLLFFLAALRGGDVRGWLGEDAGSILQRFKPAVLARLGDDFTRLGRIAKEPAGDWRIVLIPFHNGSQIEQIHLFTRRQDVEEDDEEGQESVRFVVDVELRRLGRLQLDGLIRNRNRLLDLIVRTAEPLPAAMRDDIRRIFREANELTGIRGGVVFQSTPPGFVEIPPAEPEADRVGLIV